MPDPERKAARAHRWAAPVMPAEPAATQSAVFHLCQARVGRGSHARTSLRSTSEARTDEVSRPMSATVTSPARSMPAPMSRPGFRAANVTVRWARTAPSPASPVRPLTPDGMSTASTGAPAGSGASYVPLNPVP